MAEAEKFAKLREERLQKQLEDNVKKQDRKRQDEVGISELDYIEHEIEEIRKSMCICHYLYYFFFKKNQCY